LEFYWKVFKTPNGSSSYFLHPWLFCWALLKESEEQMKEKYTFGWHDPRSLYGEPKMVKVEEDKPNVPLWFRLVVKLFYWRNK
jgi:hypothetical protein